MRALRPLVLAALLGGVPVMGSAGPASGQAPSPDHVQAFGGAPHHGSLDTLRAGGHPVPDASPVALLPTRSGNGYSLVLADGAVYSFGDASFHGAMPGTVVAGAVRTAGGGGYFLFDDQGGVFSFGDARFLGSLPGLRGAGLPIGDARVVAMGTTPTGQGYWLVDDQGGVFAFGDAAFAGSIPALRAAGVPVGAARVVALGVPPSGEGYWLVDEVGGVFSFGDATFHGSAAPEGLAEPVVGFASLPTGAGYRILTADGRVRSYGAAPDHGSAGVALHEGALALASSPAGTGYWVLTPHDRPAAGAPPLPPGSGSGRRVVYSNSRQRVWLVEGSEVVTASWPVSGRRGVPSPGTYHVFSKSPASSAHGGQLRLAHMVRFARGQRLAIGFHAIPTAGGRPIQSLDELGQFRSAGCVRQAPGDARHLYDWAPIGTTVIVTP